MRSRVSYFMVLSTAILAACAGQASRTQFQLPSGEALLSALATLEGALRDHPTASEIATYFDPASPGDSALYEVAVARAESHLPALVDCIADTMPAKVRYQERAVSRGAVCWWVLWNTSWFEQQLPIHGAGPDVPLDMIDAGAQLRARDYWKARIEGARGRESPTPVT